MGTIEEMAEKVASQIPAFTKEGKYITRAMLVAENADLRRQLADAKADVEHWKNAAEEATEGAANIAGCVDDAYRQNEKLMAWISDLQSGMFVNCVYCGHRYGPSDEVPSTIAEVLKQHIETCSEHPMSVLKAQIKALHDLFGSIDGMYQYILDDSAVTEKPKPTWRGFADWVHEQVSNTLRKEE